MAENTGKTLKSGISTIKLSINTKKRLEKLKLYEKESYDKVIQKLLDILNTLKDNPIKARISLERIDKLKTDLKEN